MTHNSSEFLQSLQQRTEAILQKAISEWQMLPPVQLVTKPAPDQWSAAQCLEHLNKYGHHYLPAFEQAIHSVHTGRVAAAGAFRSGWLGAYFTRIMLPQQDGSLQKKMQSPKNAIPADAPDPANILAEFIEQQERMLQLLESANAVDLGKSRIPTSLSPWIKLKLGDALAFVVAHNERHVVQAARSIGL